jgi:hypothetical protein
MTTTQSVRASFDVSTVEGQMRIFNAKSGSSISMKTLGDKYVIDATGILQYETTTDSYGAEQQATVTVIFDKDGTSYAAISDTVAKSGENLIDFMLDTGLPEVKVQVIKAKSSKGNEFLNLQLVM